MVDGVDSFFLQRDNRGCRSWARCTLLSASLSVVFLFMYFVISFKSDGVRPSDVDDGIERDDQSDEEARHYLL